jgi:hypothetical protein
VKFQAYVDPRVVIYDRYRFIVQATNITVIKIFSSTLNLGQNKLECLSLIIFSRFLKFKNIARLELISRQRGDYIKGQYKTSKYMSLCMYGGFLYGVKRSILNMYHAAPMILKIYESIVKVTCTINI